MPLLLTCPRRSTRTKSKKKRKENIKEKIFKMKKKRK